MKSITKTVRVILSLLLISSALSAPSLVNAFQEGWESSSIGTYTPDMPWPFIDGDEGDWILAATAEFPECGSTPHTAEILLSGGNKSLRLTSNVSNCFDNVWVHIVEIPELEMNTGFSIPLTAGTVISFEETGSLINPETGPHTCLIPSVCSDNVSVVLEDTRGNMLAYVLQRAPDATPNVYRSYYREIFLDPNEGVYSRNLFSDFQIIPDFIPTGVSIRQVVFQVSNHGTATIDNICIGTSGCITPTFVSVPDLVGLTQSAAEAAIVAASLSVGTVTTQISNTVPAGSVISQAPAAGTEATPGTEVDLVVSAGAFISANFIADSRSGVAPLRVNFTDKSTGTITSWNWNFGDGASSAIQNPSHTYTNLGTYSVSLTVSGPDGSDTVTKTDYIFAGISNINEFKILPSDGTANDYFGRSVSISGGYAIVGAYWDNDNGDVSGSAYIFERSGSSWNQVAKLTASDGAAGDHFGCSVSISGDYAIVGAYRDQDNVTDTGSAYIFERNGSSWNQVAKLTASDGAAFDYFGCSVSISGGYAIVGANWDDAKGTDSGSAYIFERNGSSWNQVAKLTASDGAARDYFGTKVSISGDYAIVGASYDDDNGDVSGSAYIFERIGSSWNQVAKLTASDGAAFEYFGCSVSISGGYAIVGAYGGDDDNGTYSGSAYIFERSGSSWNQVAKLTASGAAIVSFGISVSISGGYAIAVAYDPGENSGSAYIFDRSGSGWNQVAKLNASDGAYDDWFGFSVSISGEYAIVGAYGDDDNGSRSGSAYIFNFSIPGDIAMPWIPLLLLDD